jgi:hypothetical protein
MWLIIGHDQRRPASWLSGLMDEVLRMVNHSRRGTESRPFVGPSRRCGQLCEIVRGSSTRAARGCASLSGDRDCTNREFTCRGGSSVCTLGLWVGQGLGDCLLFSEWA